MVVTLRRVRRRIFRAKDREPKLLSGIIRLSMSIPEMKVRPSMDSTMAEAYKVSFRGKKHYRYRDSPLGTLSAKPSEINSPG